MYGWINCCLESLLIKTHGIEIWHQVLEEAQLNGDFIRSINYSDDSTYKLVEISCKLLNTTANDLLEAFGRHFVKYVEEYGYYRAVSYQGKTFDEWLRNLNEPHRILKSRFPDCKFPDFWCTNGSEYDRLDPCFVAILHYKSSRVGLGPIAVGLVKQGAFDYFGLVIDMAQVDTDESQNGVNVVSWKVSKVDNDNTDTRTSSTLGTSHSVDIISTQLMEYNNDHKEEEDLYRDKQAKTETAINGCPFAAMAKQMRANNKSNEIYDKNNTKVKLSKLKDGAMVQSNWEDSNSTSDDGYQSGYTTTSSGNYHQDIDTNNIGLNPNHLRRIFPFHFIVNQDLHIVQTGEQLIQFIQSNSNSSSSQDKKMMNQPAKQLFNITIPCNSRWDWRELTHMNDNLAVELQLLNTISTKIVTLKGSVMIIDQYNHQKNRIEKYAMFLVSPNINNINELQQYQLHLSDIPRHSFQRDAIVLGDHIKTETELAAKLDALSKRLEEERRISTESLKTKRIFVRYVSHEVRTPLNIALLGIQYLEKVLGNKSTAKQQVIDSEHNDISDLIFDVKSSCAVAVEILNDLLLYEKIESGVLQLTMTDTSVVQFMQETLSSLRLHAVGAEIDFTITYKNVPDDITISIDRIKLSQVIRNLVSNAFKFTSSGGKVELLCEIVPANIQDVEVYFTNTLNGTKEKTSSFSAHDIRASFIGSPRKVLEESPTIKTKNSPCGRNADYLMRLSIIDNGPGISEADQYSLFREFGQVKAEILQNGQGSGLGLWIARNIVKLHHGRIGVYSRGEGFGSTFLLDIPISQSVCSTIKHNIVTRNASMAVNDEKVVKSTKIDNSSKYEDTLMEDIPQVIKNCRLLIVDDVGLNRKMEKRLVMPYFEHIDEAENGLDAINKYKHAIESDLPYHVIMMDYLMPVMNGLECTQKLRQIGRKDCLIIGVTGNGLREDIDAFLQAGADLVMIKPLKVEEFMQFVHAKYSNLVVNNNTE